MTITKEQIEAAPDHLPDIKKRMKVGWPSRVKMEWMVKEIERLRQALAERDQRIAEFRAEVIHLKSRGLMKLELDDT